MLKLFPSVCDCVSRRGSQGEATAGEASISHTQAKLHRGRNAPSNKGVRVTSIRCEVPFNAPFIIFLGPQIRIQLATLEADPGGGASSLCFDFCCDLETCQFSAKGESQLTITCRSDK